jgi:putative ABC transport system ATP-binding protein
MTEVVRAEGVWRRFRAGDTVVEAVRGVSLSAVSGELLLILGRSGGGKSTLLSLLGGLDRPDAGAIAVARRDLTRLDGRELEDFLQASVGWVFQSSGLIPLLTAEENVGVALRAMGRRGAQVAARSLEALDLVGLVPRAHHRAAELSGGEQQRVALARALVKEPALLLADEPTSQLDTETARAIMVLVREIAHAGTCVVMATHDAGTVEFADRVLRLEDGRLLEAAPAERRL